MLDDLTVLTPEVNLSDGTIVAVAPGTPPMTEDDSIDAIRNIRKEWRIVDYGNNVRKLESGFKFSNYNDSCKFAGLVSRLCRENGYAPDITFGKDYAFVALFNRDIQGLHMNEFVMAAKIDEMLAK
jgi:4a-hydroxytetrahydrobiopterin dehydratase